MFHQQATIGPPGSTRNPAACELYFLGLKLGSGDVLGNIAAAGIVIAGSVAAIVPVAGVAGAGPTVQFAFGSKGFACIGFGGALGTLGRAFNIGILTSGDLGNAESILSGLSVSVVGQSPSPFVGGQAIAGSGGVIAGPTVGTPGGSLSATYSRCTGGLP